MPAAPSLSSRGDKSCVDRINVVSTNHTRRAEIKTIKQPLPACFLAIRAFLQSRSWREHCSITPQTILRGRQCTETFSTTSCSASLSLLCAPPACCFWSGRTECWTDKLSSRSQDLLVSRQCDNARLPRLRPSALNLFDYP